ncbi:MAG: transposase, partial [Desulfuromonadales bacterium]
SPYGISIWVHILLAKFLYAQPLHRALRELSGLGLSMSPWSMTGGLQKIAALFIPLQAALYEHQMSESRFHNDESRWEVYAELDGKVGHRWYLWVTKSALPLSGEGSGYSAFDNGEYGRSVLGDKYPESPMALR